MDTPSWPSLIRALIGGRALTAEQTAWAMNEIMEGAASAAQIAGFGVGLRAKGETAEEMAGLAASMLAHATPLSIPGPVTDLVGTGGDGLHTVNVSTMATIVAAAAGVPMVKHGNRAASSACGAADVLEALGVVIDLPPAATEALFAEIGVAFLFAAAYHPSLRHAGPVRSQLGVPTAFNYLGPLTNPARPTSLAVGVADPAMGPVLAGVYASRGESALVFHGEGLDELTTTGPSTVWIATGGTVTVTDFDPVALGLPRAKVEDLRGGAPPENAEATRRLLAGRTGPVRDIVLLNAAAAMTAAGGLSGLTSADDLAKALGDGLARAADAVDSGAAADLLDRWTQVSNRLATPRPRS
jgi:anthranilate phosphoribosyltransferase